jgi:c-di-GMP-binding flagellar brake protein YcgR
MDDQSLEFNKIKDIPGLPEIVRKSFRIPFEENQKVWVLINNKRYPVLDICLDGIGIALDDNQTFTIDQTVNNCELNVLDESIKNLNGRIIHSSLCIGEDWQCGIQWKDMDEVTARQISMIVLKMKEQLLKDNTVLKEY